MKKAPPCGEALIFGDGSVAVGIRARPDQLHALFAFHFNQGGIDWSRKARVVQFDREIVAFGPFGLLLPGGTQFDVMWCTT